MILSKVIWVARIIMCLVLSAVAFFVAFALLSWLASTVSGVAGSAAVDAVSWLGFGDMWAGVHEEGGELFAILPLAVSAAIGGVVFYKTYTFGIFRHL